MNPIDLSYFLKLNGWEIKKETTTEIIFYHKTKDGKIRLPITSEEIPVSTIDEILKKAGLKK